MEETEIIRRVLVYQINSRLSADEQERYQELVAKYGENDVFDTKAVEENFEITGFMAPFVVAIRNSDHKKGTLQFCHSPRFYFGFEEY